MRGIACFAGAAAFCLLEAAPSAALDLGRLQPGASAAPDELVRQGLRYEHAEGVPRDFDRAIAHFCAAVRAGSGAGAYELAVMRLNGRGVERSDAKAIYWLELARARDHRHASALLARLRSAAEADAELCRRGGTSQEASPGLRKLAPPAEISKLVGDLAPRFDLDPALVTAVIAVESNFRADAVSPKRAQGLMQLIPETAARFGVANAFDPGQNIKGGMTYLRTLLRLFDGDVTLALAAYNAGEGAVLRHRGVPPYQETQEYLARIRNYYDRRHHPVPAAPAP